MRSDGPLGVCRAESVPHLAQDLRLAEDHGIQSRRDLEQVLCRVVLVVGVERLGELLRRDLAGLGEDPLERKESRVIRANPRVDLDPVAGREDDGLVDLGLVDERAIGLWEIVGDEGQALQELHPGPPVRHAQREDRHQCATARSASTALRCS